MIPTLETERLILRAARFSDWPAYCAFMMSDRAKYLGGPYDEKGAWGNFCHDTALWTLFGHGALMVDDKETSQIVGQVGINAGPLFPERETGWMLYPGYEGRGYAFEAALALRDWAYRTLKLPPLVSYIHPDNHPSIKLAEKLGAKLDHQAPRTSPEDLVYRHPTDG